ncbi:MAG: ATP-dependent sacrificial sulfur transferase LarE [Candidatus Nitrosothermus koennekii]|nr:MAG: ATP-dependent sacrificial sulfur transferase LarE [Candidatus Nitrosothermus koennekii]
MHDDLSRLVEWFRNNCNDGVIVAFSGGVDSSLVAYAANLAIGDKALAVIADYKTLAKDELSNAIRVAKEIGINYKVIEYDELQNENFIKNDLYRCYYCRDELAKHLLKIAEEYGYSLIVDGTNIDDLNDTRYGLIALQKHGVRSPLVELSINKDKVRMLAKEAKLSVYDKPSNACLASRIPKGIRVTYDRLERIENAERIVKNLFGVRQVRVRDHDGIARIEVGRDERHLLFDVEKLDQLDSKLKALGFKYVTIDAMGYKSGSLNIIS